MKSVTAELGLGLAVVETRGNEIAQQGDREISRKAASN